MTCWSNLHHRQKYREKKRPNLASATTAARVATKIVTVAAIRTDAVNPDLQIQVRPKKMRVAQPMSDLKPITPDCVAASFNTPNWGYRLKLTDHLTCTKIKRSVSVAIQF